MLTGGKLTSVVLNANMNASSKTPIPTLKDLEARADNICTAPELSKKCKCGDMYYNSDVGGRPKYVYMAEVEADYVCATFSSPLKAEEGSEMLKHRKNVYECNIDYLQRMVSGKFRFTFAITNCALSSSD